MPVTIKVVAERRPAVPNASALAKLQATKVRNYLAESLVNGYMPATGEARPRKGDGKPLGLDTGKLARGLRVVGAGSTRTTAAFGIEPSADRKMLTDVRVELGGMSFIDRHQIITLDGIVQELIAEGTDEYMRSLR
jgi:hypothetical protein